MNKLLTLWLLALPYVVTSRTVNVIYDDGSHARYGKRTQYQVTASSEIVNAFYSKDVAEDLAAALNEAHERRTGMDKIIVHPNLYPKPFDYKGACGQDDCGSEPDSK